MQLRIHSSGPDFHLEALVILQRAKKLERRIQPGRKLGLARLSEPAQATKRYRIKAMCPQIHVPEGT